MVLTTLHAAQADEFTNFLGMTFIPVPGGSFNMGAAEKTPDVMPHELPQHTVEVPPFQIMPTEVTLALYKRYIIESARIHILNDEFMKANNHGDEAPVVFVSWTDTRYFLHWLNKNKPDDDPGTYSLPTEAEWEYACLAGQETLYCGGNKANEVGWNASQKLAYQQPVARKTLNAFDLFDMSGNVHEWVVDCHHPDYLGAPTDGSEWTGDCNPSKRIVRGGSWNDPPKSTRATSRLMVDINSPSRVIGFRVVRRLP